MKEAALPFLLLAALALFAVVPSAFLFRAGWRRGAWWRVLASAMAAVLAFFGVGFSVSSPLELNAQLEAWGAFFSLWIMLLLAFGIGALLVHIGQCLRSLFRFQRQ